MSRNMYLGHLFIDHVRPPPEELVYDPAYGMLIAGYHLCGKDDYVPLLDLYRLMLARGYPRKHAHRLALAAGGYHHNLVVLKFLQVLEFQPYVLGYPEIPEVKGYLSIRDEALARKYHLSSEHRGHVYDLLDPVDVRREGRDDYPAPGGREDVLKGPAHLFLRKCKPSLLGVRAVRKEERSAPFAILREPVEIHELAVNRGRVELEISGMDDQTRGRFYAEAYAVHNTVGDADELYNEDPEFDHLPRFYG